MAVMKRGSEGVGGRYDKLGVMGMPGYGVKHIYGNSIPIINNTSKPESAILQKNNVVCYYLYQLESL